MTPAGTTKDRAPSSQHLAGVQALQSGRINDAIDLLTAAAAAEPSSAPLLSDLGLALTSAKRFDEAAAALRSALELQPSLATAALNLGNVHRQCGDAAEAETAYRQALAAAPDFAEAHSNLALLMIEQGRPAEAEEHCRRALATRPDLVPAWEHLGLALDHLGRPDEAIAALRRAVEIRPASATAHATLAKTLAAYGRLDEAAASYRAASALRPQKASWRRALDRIVPADDAQIAADEAALADAATPDAERAQLGFKLGKAHEDRGDYSRAFECLAQANALVRRDQPYDRGVTEAIFADIRAAFTPELFARSTEGGSNDTTPILVLGMPRSSTTLVEQILASHPQVFGAGELPLLNMLALRLAAGDLPLRFAQVLPSVTPEAWTTLGADYARQLRAFAPGSRFVTDKMPGNFLLIGLIRLAMPRARIIHCRRDPADTAMSIFRTSFAAGNVAYGYDLGDIGHYYRHYAELMAYWHEVLPGFIYDIQYETLVSDQEGETRRLLERCGLEWDPRCLDFPATARPVHTASWAQVRQPIFDRSIGVAARYGDRLQPLYDALRIAR